MSNDSGSHPSTYTPGAAATAIKEYSPANWGGTVPGLNDTAQFTAGAGLTKPNLDINEQVKNVLVTGSGPYNFLPSYDAWGTPTTNTLTVTGSFTYDSADRHEQPL